MCLLCFVQARAPDIWRVFALVGGLVLLFAAVLWLLGAGDMLAGSVRMRAGRTVLCEGAAAAVAVAAAAACSASYAAAAAATSMSSSSWPLLSSMTTPAVAIASSAREAALILPPVEALVLVCPAAEVERRASSDPPRPFFSICFCTLGGVRCLGWSPMCESAWYITLSLLSAALDFCGEGSVENREI